MPSNSPRRPRAARDRGRDFLSRPHRPSPRGRAGAGLRCLRRLWADEGGGEVLEYVFIAALISIAAIAIITTFGTKVLARWTSVNQSM